MFEMKDHCWVAMDMEQATDFGLAPNFAQGSSATGEAAVRTMAMVDFSSATTATMVSKSFWSSHIWLTVWRKSGK